MEDLKVSLEVYTDQRGSPDVYHGLNIFISVQRISPQKTLDPNNSLLRGCRKYSCVDFPVTWDLKVQILKLLGYRELDIAT